MNTLKKPASEETIPQLIIVDGGSEQLAFDERDIDQMQTILAQFSETRDHPKICVNLRCGVE